MFKVVNVWGGCYVGGGDYEGGSWYYKTSDGKVHDITYEVDDTDYDTLVEGLIKEVKRLRRKKDIINKDKGLELKSLDYVERLIFTLDDETELVFD